MADKYKPTALDIAWMTMLVSKLNLNGIWNYMDQPIQFRKTAEKTMALVVGDDRDPHIAEQIARNRVVMAAAGIKFEDRRGSR